MLAGSLLASLTSLDISSNNLTSSLPSTCELCQCSRDLACNSANRTHAPHRQLCWSTSNAVLTCTRAPGPYPWILAGSSLSSLAHLDVQYNNLTGSLPAACE